MLPKGSRILAKGGTRHLRFLIPPLATPPDLPPAAAPCGRAAKSGAAIKTALSSTALRRRFGMASPVICRALLCAANHGSAKLWQKEKGERRPTIHALLVFSRECYAERRKGKLGSRKRG